MGGFLNFPEVEFIENVKINKSNKPYPNKFYNLYGTPCMLVCSSNLFVFVAVPVSAQTERQAVDMVRNTNKFLKGKEKTDKIDEFKLIL